MMTAGVRLRREGLYPRVLSISIPHPALHKYIPHFSSSFNTKPLAYYYKFRGSTDCQ